MAAPVVRFDRNTSPTEFEVIEKIGVGGFGAVLHLVHQPTQIELAGKMIAPALLTPETEQTLRKEVALMEQLNIKYIIHYFGTINYESQDMVLMEFCDCGSLRDLMDFRDQVLNEQQIAFVLHDVLCALDELWQRHQIFHRDIKAGNILFNSKCEVKLTDFGVSRQFDPNAITFSTKSMIGTPYWMAPEVIMQTKSSWPSDIWSVGATAVELAEGGPPYCEFPATRAMTEISVNGFLGFRNVDYFSEAFTDFVSLCMDKDARRRPTARELIEHPFIKQIESLDRFQVFEDLPQTRIDFAQLLENAEEEEAGEAAAPKDAGARRGIGKTLSAATKAEDTRRKVGYATFRPPAAAGSEPTDIYRKPPVRQPTGIAFAQLPSEERPQDGATPDEEPIEPPPQKAEPIQPTREGQPPLPTEEIAAPAQERGGGVSWKAVVLVLLFVVLVWRLGLRAGVIAFFILFAVGYAALSRGKAKQD
jgi:serine/threonine protein kinase